MNLFLKEVKNNSFDNRELPEFIPAGYVPEKGSFLNLKEGRFFVLKVEGFMFHYKDNHYSPKDVLEPRAFVIRVPSEEEWRG